MEFDTESYFERIGWKPAGGESQTDILRNIHIHHIMNIPFEDLDPYRGIEVSVEPQKVFDKIVRQGRGGYCFEQNCLLCEALNASGIKTYGVLARVAGPDGFGAHSHRMNIAEVGSKRWIADVGFGGDCFVLPLELKTGEEQTDGRNVYRVARGDTVQYSVQIEREGKFTDMLGFDDIPARACDFELSNFYTNCHPQSAFRRFIMCSRSTENGKYTIFGKYASVTENGVTRHFEAEGGELRDFLTEKLKINMEGISL